MPEPIAIAIKNVSKRYRLFGSQREQLVDVLGLNRLFRQKPTGTEFTALDNVSLTVPRGHRIGIIGRNGAGKTTLLKLICGNFSPTSGEIEVNGTVQALLTMGTGFHPDFTGRENVKASLAYNGLGPEAYEAALADVVEFCELGQFLDQPFKTYSLGMQARLMFATATAVQPDILIIDEVLGAGDGYFITKSKLRVEKLVHSGATMLLVSHSTQQVLELCKEVIWMDQGKIRMQGDAFEVVKAYEEFLHGPSARPEAPNATTENAAPLIAARDVIVPAGHQLQNPYFQPHAQTVAFPDLPASAPQEMKFLALGGFSRWESELGVKVCGFTLQTPHGETNRLPVLEPMSFVIFTRADITGPLALRYGIAIHDLMGNCVTRIFSPVDRYEATCGEIRQIRIALNPLQLGPGEYIIGISISDGLPLEQINGATRYDLVARSFTMRIETPDSLAATGAIVYHSAEWSFLPR